MVQDQPQNISNKPVEKVGVIIVHGIGEQKRFEFLESETRKIVDAIIANYGQRRRDITPTLMTGTGDSFHGQQASWVSGGAAPLHTLVELEDRLIDIGFHEVWWADINEQLTLGKQVRFWAWGLSLAGIATHNDVFLPGATSRTRPPQNHGKLTWWNRLRMGYVSALFGFSAFSIALINLVLKRLSFAPLFSTGTIVNYLSGVKIYSQDSRAGGSTMDGPDEPPRAAIRRRMIRAMSEVATAGYDRWYILAHSLGTIVAWNGLMEIQQALPNYLDRKFWDSTDAKPLRGKSPAPFGINAMMPNRPLWLDNRDIIERDALFQKFRGVLTYGSPLERFCALWSAMVPINQKEDSFQKGTEWVNVYDPTDPVGTWLEDYDPEHQNPPRPGYTKLKPHNFPCRASPLLLVSHLDYLNAPQKCFGAMPADGEYFLINQVAHWLVEGGSLASRIEQAPKGRRTFWMRRAASEKETHRLAIWRVAWSLTQQILAGTVLTVLTVLSLRYAIIPFANLVKTWLAAFVKILIAHSEHPGLVNRIQPILGFFSRIHSDLAALIISVADWLNHHLCLAPWLARFFSEAIWLWVATAIVVVLASLYHHYWSSLERKELGKRTQQQKNMREKHFA